MNIKDTYTLQWHNADWQAIIKALDGHFKKADEYYIKYGRRLKDSVPKAGNMDECAGCIASLHNLYEYVFDEHMITFGTGGGTESTYVDSFAGERAELKRKNVND